MGPYRVVLPNCGKPRSGSERGDLIKAERNEPGKTTGVHLSRSRRSGLLFLRSFFYLAIFAASWVSPSNRSIANYLPATTSILSYVFKWYLDQSLRVIEIIVYIFAFDVT